MTAQPTRDQLRALANAATEGPWEFQHWGGQNQNGDYAESILFDGHGETMVYGVADQDGEFIAAARTAVPQLLDQLDQAEHRIARLEAQTSIRGRAVVYAREGTREAEAERDRNLRNSREAKKRAIRAEARIKRLENRAASETARANEWRRKHRVMAEKRDAAHRAWFEEAKARREAETRVKAVRDVLDRAHDEFEQPSEADIRRALEG